MQPGSKQVCVSFIPEGRKAATLRGAEKILDSGMPRTGDLFQRTRDLQLPSDFMNFMNETFSEDL